MRLTKSRNFVKYKGFLIEPDIQNFLSGRVWAREVAPFPQEKMEQYIRRGLLQVKPAIGDGPICNRCLNEDRRRFIHFTCARCQKTCVYCRHCIQMGRMASCTELVVWNGPLPQAFYTHPLDWKSQFTPLQAQASRELAESMRQGRSHLIHAVCEAKNEDGTFYVKNSTRRLRFRAQW